MSQLDPERYRKHLLDNPQVPQPVRLAITLYPDGAMSVEGPTDAPQFCKRMLEAAWEAISQRATKKILTPAECGEIVSGA